MSQSRSREPCRSWPLEVVFAWTRPCGSLAFHGSDFKEKRGIFAKCPSCLRHKWHSTPSYEVFDIGRRFKNKIEPSISFKIIRNRLSYNV